MTDDSRTGPLDQLQTVSTANRVREPPRADRTAPRDYSGPVMVWICPDCTRTFRRPNTRHACGVGDRAALLWGKRPELVVLYEMLERAVTKLGSVEVVTRDRYVLFRTTRIFADLVFMRDALRLAIHLDREVRHRSFFKVAHGSNRRVTHVAKLTSPADVRALLPHVARAHRLTLNEDAERGAPPRARSRRTR